MTIDHANAMQKLTTISHSFYMRQMKDKREALSIRTIFNYFRPKVKSYH